MLAKAKFQKVVRKFTKARKTQGRRGKMLYYQTRNSEEFAGGG